MLYLSSKKDGAYGVTNTDNMIEIFYAPKELLEGVRQNGWKVRGVPVLDKVADADNVLLKDFVAMLNNIVKSQFASGRGKDKERCRDSLKRYIASVLAKSFSNYAFEFVDYPGLGYYNGYSDFAVCLKYRDISLQLVGIGTHSHNIDRAYYRAEVDISSKQEIEAFYDIKMEDMSLLTICAYSEAYAGMLEAQKQVKQYLELQARMLQIKRNW